MKNLLIYGGAAWILWRTYQASAMGVELIDAWKNPFTGLDELKARQGIAGTVIRTAADAGIITPEEGERLRAEAAGKAAGIAGILASPELVDQLRKQLE